MASPRRVALSTPALCRNERRPGRAFKSILLHAHARTPEPLAGGGEFNAVKIRLPSIRRTTSQRSAPAAQSKSASQGCNYCNYSPAGQFPGHDLSHAVVSTRSARVHRTRSCIIVASSIDIGGLINHASSSACNLFHLLMARANAVFTSLPVRRTRKLSLPCGRIRDL